MSGTIREAAGRRSTPVRRAIAAICAFCLLLAACGSDEPGTVAQADESLAPASTPAASDASGDDGAVDAGNADQAADASDSDANDTADDDGAEGTGAEGNGDTESAEAADSSDDDDSDDEPRKGLDKETIGDRGLRIPGEERPEAEPNAAEPTVTAAAVAEPTATPEPEPVSVEPTPTPAPTPTPPPQNDPVGQPPAQLPQGPVPSDDLVIQGPATDDGSDIEIISDAGILACVTVESAIQFLDRGDLGRTSETLQAAGAYAASASESGIAALASQLSSAGRDSDASFDAIAATLSACARYGYEV